MKKIIYTIFLMAGICSCGSRKSEVAKSETKLEAKTEVTDNGSAEKTEQGQVIIKQKTSLKEDENVISEETQTDYTAIDPAKPIIEVVGNDTVKVYNANKSVKTTKTTAKRQTEANTTVDSNKVVNSQEKQQNALTVKREVKADESQKGKITDRTASMVWLPLSLGLVMLIVLLLLWWRKKKE